MPLEFAFIVNISDMQSALVESRKAGNAGLCNRKFEIAKLSEPRLYARYKRKAIFAQRINRNALGAEKIADFLSELINFLVKATSSLDFCNDLLQRARAFSTTKFFFS